VNRELVVLGFLVQASDDYLFTLPNSAKVYAPTRAARDEIKRILNRQPFKEILLSVWIVGNVVSDVV
jgi:hypothetical protein